MLVDLTEPLMTALTNWLAILTGSTPPGTPLGTDTIFGSCTHTCVFLVREPQARIELATSALREQRSGRLSY